MEREAVSKAAARERLSVGLTVESLYLFFLDGEVKGLGGFASPALSHLA